VQRGNNRSTCFLSDQDREYFRRALRDTSATAGCSIHAYVIMTNHVHLLATARESESAARMMQALGRRYVRYFNDRYERTGTLWEGRFRSTLVDSERYFLACSRYIETNPIRAGMAVHAEHYRWSSFRCNALGEPDLLVTPHQIYLALGDHAPARQSSYRALFSAPQDPRDLEGIRRATRAGTVLGSDGCRAALEAELGRPLGRKSHGGDRRSRQFTSTRPTDDER
jgi:putative transposase